MKNIKDTWNQVLASIEENVTPVSYNTFFNPLKIHSMDEQLKIGYIEAEDDFIVTLIKNRYIPLIESSFKAVSEEHQGGWVSLVYKK